MRRSSWKTSITGLMAGLSLLLAQAMTLTDEDPLTNPEYALVISGISMIMMGLSARDNNVTSEQAGLKTRY
jgi:hypothetical protein